MTERLPTLLLLSNVNLEPLQNRSVAHSVPFSIRYDGFNTLGQRLSEGFDSLGENCDRIWIHADLNYPGLANGDFRNVDIRVFKEETIPLLDQCIEKLATCSDTRFLFSTFYFHSLWNRGQSFTDHQSDLNHHFNQWLIRRVTGYANIDLFPFDRLVSRLGEETVYDPRLWVVGRIPYSSSFLDSWVEAVGNLLPTLDAVPKKVLALDLDHTLWGGTIDEQETTSLQLGSEGPGLAYQNFQRAILGLKQRGVLLAIVSKNDEKEVSHVLEHHPFMVLKKTDFAEILANWETKSSNLMELSRRLGLAPDSFVMLDDSPRERTEIAQHLPEVALPEFPDDPADLDQWFFEEVVARYFNFRSLTEADTRRPERYRARKERLDAEQRYANIENFLRSLDIRFHIAEVQPEEHARVFQLLQRTNQFNLNKKPELLLQSTESLPDRKTWVLHYRDVFGVEGLVGAIVLRERPVPQIESFAVSCRVLGKRVEHALLLKALETIQQPEITLLYEATGKNRQMEAFLRALNPQSTEDHLVIGPVSELIETLRESIQCITHESS